MDLSDEELAARRAAWSPRPQKPNTKGVLNNYARLVHSALLVHWGRYTASAHTLRTKGILYKLHQARVQAERYFTMQRTAQP